MLGFAVLTAALHCTAQLRNLGLRPLTIPTGVQAVLAGERITGEGFVASLDHEVGISFWEAEPFIGFIVLFLLCLGVYPSRTRLLHPRQRDRAQLFAGLQRLVGRLACLTLAGTIILEVLTGKVCQPNFQALQPVFCSKRIDAAQSLIRDLCCAYARASCQGC